MLVLVLVLVSPIAMEMGICLSWLKWDKQTSILSYTGSIVWKHNIILIVSYVSYLFVRLRYVQRNYFLKLLHPFSLKVQ